MYKNIYIYIMPYFHNEDINLLFIHIPKTGGSSLEHYFSKKYSIEINIKSLFTLLGNSFLTEHGFKSSLQHLTYNTIFELRELLNVHFTEDLKILTVVRNPYTRIISDLFFYKLIHIDTTTEEVYDIIMNKYLHKDTFDNHNIPQYLFVTNQNGEFIDNLTILKMETLNFDMKNIGYSDFDVKANTNQNKVSNYYNYLNYDSISIINSFYEKDFEFFGYDKIIIT